MSKQIAIRSSKPDVVAFLHQMKEKLNSPMFNVERDFYSTQIVQMMIPRMNTQTLIHY